MAAHDHDRGEDPIARLSSLLPPERILRTLTPEQRLVGLTLEQIIPILPDELLRALSRGYLAPLPEPIRDIVHARIGR